jgi:hypothetical protein
MRIAILLLAALALAGCGSSRPVRDVQPQGFLGDCSQLTSGGEGEAGCDTSTPTSSGPSYDKVIVAPVTVWQSPATANIPEADLKTAADYLYTQLRNELGKDFRRDPIRSASRPR